MGAEKVDELAEDDGGDRAAAADKAGDMVRRYVIDPGRRVVMDGSGNHVSALMGIDGEAAFGAESSGTASVMDMGRKLVGAETPEPPTAAL